MKSKTSFWIGIGLGAISGIGLAVGSKRVRDMAEDIKEKAEDKMNDIHSL